MIQRFSSSQYRAIWKIRAENRHGDSLFIRVLGSEKYITLFLCSSWRALEGRRERHIFLKCRQIDTFSKSDSWNDFAGLVFEIRLHLYLFISISITLLSYKCYARSIGSQCSKWIRASFRPATPRKDFSPSITNHCVDGGHDVETSIDPSEHD